MGSCQHPSGKPGASGKADLDGWRNPDQAASHCRAQRTWIFPRVSSRRKRHLNHLTQCCRVPSGDGSSLGTSVFVGCWGQISRHFSAVFLSLGKLKVEMPPEEHAPGMIITETMLQIQSPLFDGDVFMGSKLLPTAKLACLRQ